MIPTAIRRAITISALVLLTGGVAHADIAPPEDDDKDGGGCLAGEAPLALAPIGLGIALALRKRR